MISVASVEQAGICPTKLASTIKIRSSVLGAGAFVLVLFSGSAAQAQCTSVGLNGLNAAAPIVAQAAGMAVANGSHPGSACTGRKSLRRGRLPVSRRNASQTVGTRTTGHHGRGPPEKSIPMTVHQPRTDFPTNRASFSPP